MAKIVIDSQKCKGCMLCVSVCPRKKISVSEKLNRRGIRVVKFKDDGLCLGCGMCAIICPDCCIEVYK